MTTRAVEVRLKITGNPAEGQKALRDIEGQAKKTDKALSDMRTSLSRVGSAGPGGPGGANLGAAGFQKGGGGAGIFGGGLGTLNELAGGLGLFAAGARGVQQTALNAGRWYDQYINVGHTRRLGETNWLTDVQAAQRSSMQPLLLERDRINVQRDNYQRQSTVMDIAAPDRVGNVAKHGRRFADAYSEIDVAQSIAERELSKEVSHKEALSKAEEELSKEAKGTAESLKYLQEEFDKLSVQQRDDPKRAELSAEISRVNEERKAILERRRAIAGEMDASNQTIQQRQADLRNVERTRLVADRDKARTLFEEARAGSIGFSAADPGSRYDTLASLQQMKQKGFGSLGPEQRAMLLGNPLTQEFAGNAAADWAKADPVTNQILALTGRKSLGDMQTEMETTAAKVDIQVSIDQKALEEGIRKAFEEQNILPLVLEAIRVEQGVLGTKAREAAITAGLVTNRR